VSTVTAHINEPGDHVAHDDGHEGAHRTSFGMSNTKLAMWVFLSTDCLFFGTLISVYFLYRAKPPGPYAFELYDIPFTSLSSFILLMSSLTMVLALSSVNRGDIRRMRIWLVATSLLGAVFLGGQIYEFTAFIREGLTMKSSVSGASFFTLTGFHGAHVAVGILLLLSLVWMSLKGRIGKDNAETVEVIGLYWHFVDIVWIVLFVVVYLLPHPEVV
jgi:cytochrome c oxidase subunit 3/cytochrome o ubiquinol oxidase subunit 3